jgi:hypothetical protein
VVEYPVMGSDLDGDGDVQVKDLADEEHTASLGTTQVS